MEQVRTSLSLWGYVISRDLLFYISSLGPNSLIDSFSSVWFLLTHEGGRVLPFAIICYNSENKRDID